MVGCGGGLVEAIIATQQKRMVTLKISPCTNMTLTLGWITLFMGDMDEGALHGEDEVTVKQRN
jgi:hypothetical protein